MTTSVMHNAARVVHSTTNNVSTPDCCSNRLHLGPPSGCRRLSIVKLKTPMHTLEQTQLSYDADISNN
jgi:hypothetical protein